MPGTGGYNAIAIVDAYHYPTSLNDFNYFASHFGLPTESSTNALGSTNQVFQVVYASGRQPSTNGGWAQEEALDIEWAHAMAPGAKVYLVEAASSSMTDLMSAVDVASRLPNVKEVSMSWGGGEFRGETTYDVHFPRTNGIVYVAASGDTGGVVEYPAACPNVVAAGGTSVSTNSSGGLLSETGWSGSGGGTSLYEPKPSYQAGVANTPSTMRGVPDVSSDADPYTGVSVYDSTVYQRMSGWLVFGGTSVSTPCLAGMVNVSDNFYGDSTTELTLIYTDLGTTNLRDIVSGKAGRFKCLSGWDFVTGVGVPLGTNGL
jgi:subtilase family serine protease